MGCIKASFGSNLRLQAVHLIHMPGCWLFLCERDGQSRFCHHACLQQTWQEVEASMLSYLYRARADRNC